jgi:[protein-PII] uridylyltransferase
VGAGLALAEARRRLLARADLRGWDFCRAYAEAADDWLGGLLERAAGPDLSGLALIAVGGYGRQELCPGSDLDLILAHDRSRAVAPVADALWYPVWDEGVHLDHSVRTPRQVLELARRDLRVALGLLDARLVAGDPRVFAPIGERAPRVWRRGSRWFLAELGRSVEERHQASGDVAFLLEPDLKDGKGGLRDAHAVRAALAALPALASLLDLGELERAASFLLSVRVELQRPTGRRVERLALQEQDRVAAALGLQGADELMAEVARAGRAVAWASDEAWRLAAARLKRRRPGRARPLGPGLVGVGDRVELAPGASPAADPSLALRAAAAAASRGARLSRSCLERLAAEAPPLPDPWPPEALQALETVLGSGPGGVAALEALDQAGVLVRLVPEWAAVRNRPQRNAYHRFTVDRHLLETAAYASALLRRVTRPDLLLVGALLHDIGKGFPGDHTQAGVEVVGRLAARMGLPPADVAALQGMVRHHLLLADTATRRDTDDPRTIETVAEAVGDREMLELLAALTEADGLATGPAAWSPWKAALVAKLVERVAGRLEGLPYQPPPGLPTPEHRELMALGRLAVRHAEGRLCVVAPDRPGLLSVVAGVIALHSLDIRSAAAAAEDGMAVEVFEVEPLFGTAPDWGRLERDLAAALEGRLDLEAKLAERERSRARRARPASARPAEVAVLFDNEASASATVVEVRAPDGVGVLHHIARALASCGLDVAWARVTTLGSEVVDAFYVRDARGAKLLDEGDQARVSREVLAQLGARPGPA